MKLEDLKQAVEFLSFDRDPNEKVMGFIRARFMKLFIVIFPVIQKRDGDFYVANPSKSINIMGQWKPSEMAYFDQKEDKEQFLILAKDYILSQINKNRAVSSQNDLTYPHPYSTQNSASQARIQSPQPPVPDFGDQWYGKGYTTAQN